MAMSLLQTWIAWLRRTLAWSNSRQSWEERFGLLALLLGGGLMLWFGPQLGLIQQVLLWAGLVLLVAGLLRRGWLKLFGPVLFYDMIRLARRSRFYWLRVAYAALLLFFLFAAATNTYHYGLTPPQAASRLAQNFFQTFMMVQMMAVLILTPAYVAGSIAEEKEKKTLEFMLATDLRNREIVLSKLGSRVANLTLFILTGLPILSLLQFLGGVDPSLVLAGFAGTALTVAGLAGVAILNSVRCKRSRDAIGLTYLELFGYIAISLMALAWQHNGSPVLSWPLWFGNNPPTIYEAISVFNSGNLLIALGRVMQGAYTNTLDTALPEVLGEYALFHGFLATATILLAIGRLRRVAVRQMSESKHGGPTLVGAALETVTGAVLPVREPVFQRPAVSDRPMLWKELHVEGGMRMGWFGWLMVVGLIVLTYLPAFLILYDHLFVVNRWRNLAEELNAWVRTCTCIIGSLTLLAVGIRAAGAISSEREKQTYDSLMTTPLDSDEILVGKWLGSVFSVRLSWLWLGSVWLLGLIMGALHPGAIPMLIGAWLVYAAVIALIGLAFSINCRSTQRATIYTMLTALGLSFGHLLPWFCCAGVSVMPRAMQLLAQFQVSLSPPIALAFLPFCPEEMTRYGPDDIPQFVLFIMIGLFLWTLVAITLWITTSLHFRTITHRDRVLFPQRRDRMVEP